MTKIVMAFVNTMAFVIVAVNNQSNVHVLVRKS